MKNGSVRYYKFAILLAYIQKKKMELAKTGQVTSIIVHALCNLKLVLHDTKENPTKHRFQSHPHVRTLEHLC